MAPVYCHVCLPAPVLLLTRIYSSNMQRQRDWWNRPWSFWNQIASLAGGWVRGPSGPISCGRGGKGCGPLCSGGDLGSSCQQNNIMGLLKKWSCFKLTVGIFPVWAKGKCKLTLMINNEMSTWGTLTISGRFSSFYPGVQCYLYKDSTAERKISLQSVNPRMEFLFDKWVTLSHTTFFKFSFPHLEVLPS